MEMVCRLGESLDLDREYEWVAGFVLEMGYRLAKGWAIAWRRALELVMAWR